MSCSRTPGVLGAHDLFAPARTPGVLGLLDQGDPDLCTLAGDTPGVLGRADHADPSLSALSQSAMQSGAPLVRMADGTALAMPVQAAGAVQPRAPWMAIALAQASEFKGAKEGTIQKTRNFHQALNTGRASMEGTENAWCAAFVNWVLDQAGVDTFNDDFADRRADRGRAHGFYEVTKDKVKKGEKAAPLVRNPLFVEWPSPVYGAVAMVTSANGRGHHVGFVASAPRENFVVLLGGNQGDTIKFSEYNILPVAASTTTVGGKKVTTRALPDRLKFFVPVSYEATARADTQPLDSQSAETLNAQYGITTAKSTGPESTR
jgi:hypothetical protein